MCVFHMSIHSVDQYVLIKLPHIERNRRGRERVKPLAVDGLEKKNLILLK